MFICKHNISTSRRINPNIEIRCLIHKGKAHGLSEFIESICEDDSKLVIIPDAGSGDSKECEKLIKLGKDVIILDHHNIRDKEGVIPNNPAIVVNNQYSNQITDKAMTGVGIVYKFVKVLDGYYKVNYADDYCHNYSFLLLNAFEMRISKSHTHF